MSGVIKSREDRSRPGYGEDIGYDRSCTDGVDRKSDNAAFALGLPEKE